MQNRGNLGLESVLGMNGPNRNEETWKKLECPVKILQRYMYSVPEHGASTDRKRQ